MTRSEINERQLLEQVGQRRFICTECVPSVDKPTLEALGAHLERHAPVGPATFDPKKRNATSGACAKGCGRHFPFKGGTHERAHHEKLCDGSAPLPPRKSADTWPDPRPDVVDDLRAKEKVDAPAGPPPCPKCSTVPTKLSFDGYGTRYRCASGSCGHEYRVVGTRVIGEHVEPPAPASTPTPSPTVEVREGPPPPPVNLGIETPNPGEGGEPHAQERTAPAAQRGGPVPPRLRTRARGQRRPPREAREPVRRHPQGRRGCKRGQVAEPAAAGVG